ncbi:MAG: hypothetical protein JWO53_1153 [Chlamydiia bacterium]|nr:hypothetical protein [Chlamydiia bacterium]
MMSIPAELRGAKIRIHKDRMFPDLDTQKSHKGHKGIKLITNPIRRLIGNYFESTLDVALDGKVYTVGKRSAEEFLKRNVPGIENQPLPANKIAELLQFYANKKIVLIDPQHFAGSKEQFENFFEELNTIPGIDLPENFNKILGKVKSNNGIYTIPRERLLHKIVEEMQPSKLKRAKAKVHVTEVKDFAAEILKKSIDHLQLRLSTAQKKMDELSRTMKPPVKISKRGTKGSAKIHTLHEKIPSKNFVAISIAALQNHLAEAAKAHKSPKLTGNDYLEIFLSLEEQGFISIPKDFTAFLKQYKNDIIPLGAKTVTRILDWINNPPSFKKSLESVAHKEAFAFLRRMFEEEK